jgi:kinesin family protein 13
MADDMDLLDGMLDSDDGEELDLNESPSKAALPAKGKADALVEKKAQPKKGLAKGAKAGSSSGNTVGMDAADGERLWARTQEKINAPSTGEGNNIVVVTRVRPFNKREKELNTTNCIQIHASDPDNHQVWISDPGAKDPNAEPSAFRFDYCFDSFDPGGSTGTFVDQKQVFEAVGLDILAKAWSGYHACLFAYGQTGSGKTYSIMG